MDWKAEKRYSTFFRGGKSLVYGKKDDDGFGWEISKGGEENGRLCLCFGLISAAQFQFCMDGCIYLPCSAWMNVSFIFTFEAWTEIGRPFFVLGWLMSLFIYCYIHILFLAWAEKEYRFPFNQSTLFGRYSSSVELRRLAFIHNGSTASWIGIAVNR